mgnify:FL=1
MSDKVRRRLMQELQKHNIDAYLAYTPSNLFYTTGFLSPVVALSWRLMGTDLCLIPADPTLSPALITSDFVETPARASTDIEDIRTYKMWVENRDVDILSNSITSANLSRPPQWDQAEIHTALRDILGERNLDHATIGTDLRYVQHQTIELLKETNPQCKFVDVTDVLYQLRAIKQPHEIETLRKAARLYEAGQNQAIANVHEGQTALDIKYNYMDGALQAAKADPSLGDFQGAFGFISAGSGARLSFGGTSGLSSGDLIKFDCGVTLDGYYSDCGRTFSFGKPTDIQKKMHYALQSAHSRARELMRPGVQLSEIFRVATEEIRSHGFPNYSRGHYGHSIGLDSFVEEPPFISADEESILQPGMVMCLETPYYADSVGSFQIEDMILITSEGCEVFNSYGYDLFEV